MNESTANQFNSNHYWTYLWDLNYYTVVSCQVQKSIKIYGTICVNKQCQKVQWNINPLNFYIFKHFTWTNYDISVITCKICKLVILHFQACHDTFLACLYIHHVQQNLPSGLLLLSTDSNFSSEILVVILGRWWKLRCLFKQLCLDLPYFLTIFCTL